MHTNKRLLALPWVNYYPAKPTPHKGLMHFMNGWIIVAILVMNHVTHIIRTENIGIT